MQGIVSVVLLSIGAVFFNHILTWQPKPRRETGLSRALNRLAEQAYRAKHAPMGQGIKVLVPGEVLAPNSRPLRIVAAASQQYNVPPEVLLSRWYQESGMSLGGGVGVGRHLALATIVRQKYGSETAYRRGRFAQNEADLRAIAAHCGYDLEELRGSSTGAQGPFQIQPSTWVLGAVDADGDGKACPLNLADAAFTAARKLRKDYERTGSWNRAILAYAGVDCAQNRAYVQRAQPLLGFFRRFWAERFTGPYPHM